MIDPERLRAIIEESEDKEEALLSKECGEAGHPHPRIVKFDGGRLPILCGNCMHIVGYQPR